MSETTETGHDWRHGWIPLTMRAALQKAHGNREQAAALLDEAHERRNARRRARGHVEFSSPHPQHQAATAERARLRGRSDDELAEDLVDADDAGVAAILAELDRRDRSARKVQLQRERRAARRAARDAAAERAFDEHLAAGVDPEDAYAKAYGVEVERLRRDEAISTLRASGYSGKGFRELCRAAWRDHAELTYLDAEAVTRGQLVNKAGAAKGIRGRDLFTGPEATARKYATRELLDYWQQNGRMTLQDFEASAIGGAMRSKGTAAWS